MSFFRTKAAAGVFRPTPLHMGVLIAILILVFAPIARDRVNGWFVIEPLETHQAHAGIPGRVLDIYLKEGEAVSSGQVLARLQSLSRASTSEEAAAQVAASQAHVFAAEMHHSGLERR